MFELIYPVESAKILPEISSENQKISYHGIEMLPVVKETGLVYAQAPRDYCHNGSKLSHPVVHLHIINRFNQLYLQKRSKIKKLLPGKWDTAVGGHVAYGECLSEALHREAAEELGFYDFNPIYMRTYVYENKEEKELVNIFAAVGNFDLNPDNMEVDEGRYWSMDEIESNIGKSIFTPNFEMEFKMMRESLEALL